MGSEISKAYDIDLDTWTATGGHQSMWKIFPAVSKKLGHQCSGTAHGAPPSPRSSAATPARTPPRRAPLQLASLLRPRLHRPAAARPAASIRAPLTATATVAPPRLRPHSPRAGRLRSFRVQQGRPQAGGQEGPRINTGRAAARHGQAAHAPPPVRAEGLRGVRREQELPRLRHRARLLLPRERVQGLHEPAGGQDLRRAAPVYAVAIRDHVRSAAHYGGAGIPGA